MTAELGKLSLVFAGLAGAASVLGLPAGLVVAIILFSVALAVVAIWWVP